ncbi:clostripain-related cysteine peptidase [Oribacterium sp. P6A1]|uniref:clostripain-related cysteine peptidase n=1 Tax=Oribacterium sp. P6A1 TaxID=1410612 RepID=UPI00055E061A|nr:clostripain-related cysteine peptidase [Oribacterium sp. P6A1]
MREFKSRKRNDDTEERQDLKERILDFVAGNQKKVMILAVTFGAIITFSLGMLTVHMMNRATVGTDIKQQVAEVETTGEIIKITSDEGLTISSDDNSEEETAAIQEKGNENTVNGKEKVSSDASKAAGEGTAKADASKTSGTGSSAKTQSASSQAGSENASKQSASASAAASSGDTVKGTFDTASAKFDKNSDGSEVKKEETYLVLNNESETKASHDVIGEAPTGETEAATKETVSSSSDSGESTVELPFDKKKLTVLVYMIGSSLESKSNLAANSIVTMLTGNVDTNKVNVIIETGGTKKFHNISTADHKFDESKIQRWLVDGTKLRFLGNAGEAEGNSMTSGETLESFLKYAKKNFPAGRYEAVLWGQAGGPVNGFGYDEVNSSSGQLSVSGISNALSNAEMDLDLLLFDARLMGAMESGYALASHVDYMIASEDNEYSIGLNYTNWFNGISNDPSMSAIDQGKIILDDFIKDNKGKGDGMQNVVGAYSVIDLKALKRNTSDKLKNLAELLKAAEKTEDGRDHLRQAGKEAYEFAEAYSYDLVDICSFLSAIEENYKGEGQNGIDYGEIRDAAKSLKASVEKAVEVCRYVTPDDDGGVSGLTIYFPQQDTDSEKKKSMISRYEDLSFSTSYQQLIKQYAH